VIPAKRFNPPPDGQSSTAPDIFPSETFQDCPHIANPPLFPEFRLCFAPLRQFQSRSAPLRFVSITVFFPSGQFRPRLSSKGICFNRDWRSYDEFQAQLAVLQFHSSLSNEETESGQMAISSFVIALSDFLSSPGFMELRSRNHWYDTNHLMCDCRTLPENQKWFAYHRWR
jgi:hypothetical protein